MKLLATTILLLITCVAAPLVKAQEPTFQEPDAEKAAQTGFRFLSFSLDPRASAMGGALTAIDGLGAAAMLYNPATMASMQSFVDVNVSRTQFIADINYNAGSIAFSPRRGLFGVFGFSIAAVDYGEFIGTELDVNSSGADFIETGTFSPTALVVGVGYAKALSDRFSIGGNAKYAYQNLGTFAVAYDEGDRVSDDYAIGAPVFDFGVIYKTGFRSLNLAMTVRNFSQELQYEEESFELPLTFRLGMAMDLMDLTNMNPEMHSLRLAVDARRPRDYDEQIRLGGEYLFMNTLALRAGYSFPSEMEDFNLGAGLQQEFADFGFAFNYSFAKWEAFDNVHQVGVVLSY